jgi:hypothetical protein
MKIVILSQGSGGIQIPSLNLGMNTGIEAALRSLGCVFGMNSGIGGGGTNSQTLVTAAQSFLDPVLTRYQNGTGLQNGYDWISVNVEGYAVTENLIRGGAGSDALIPSNYTYFDRASSNVTLAQVVNQLAAYGYTATSGQVTYGMLHDTLVRAQQDLADWVRADARTSGAKVACWAKHDGKPLPLFGDGWWNNPGTSMTTLGNGLSYPQNGTDSLTKNAAAGMRTITGQNAWKIVDGDLAESSDTWSGGFETYPTGSHEARGHARQFEAVANTAVLAPKFDAMPSQNYQPVYPASRPLTSISNLAFATSIAPTDLTLGFTTAADRYVRRQPALDAVYLSNRLCWLASWKTFGSKASFGTEMSMDFGGFALNPFNGLATEIDDWEACYIDAVLDPVTEAESTRYGLSSNLIGTVLTPSHWFFWTAEADFLDDAFANNSGVTVLTGDALTRTRANLVWRFGGSYGASPDWAQGSAWHQHVAEQLDGFAVQRVARLRSRVNAASKANAARQSTLASLVGG